MNRLEEALRQIVRRLVASGHPFALVGGFAVSARSEPRFTRDVDLVVAVADDAVAESLLRDLAASGYAVLAAIEQAATGRLATARLASPGARESELIVDLLFASSGVEVEIAARAEPLDLLDDLVVPVARTGDLIALKLLARDDETRPQDAGDLRALRAAATPEDLERARETVRDIERRGYARGRDLAAALEALVGTKR